MTKVDELSKELEIEYNLARADYIRKKRLKGELVDEDKLRIALNQRKKLRKLTMRCLQANFNNLKSLYK